MMDEAPPGFRWSANEYGHTLVPVKKKSPEGSLKKRCYDAATKWAAEQRIPIKIVKISVGHFDSPTGKSYAIGTVGAGDFIVAINSTCLMVETKSATGRQSDGQRKMQAAWEATGNRYLLCREPEQLIAELQLIAERKYG